MYERATMKERLRNWVLGSVTIAPRWATSRGKVLLYMLVPGLPLLGMAYGLQKNWLPTLVFCLAGALAVIIIPNGAALAAALWLSAGEGVLLAALLGRKQEPNLSLFYLIVQGVLTVPFFIAIRSVLQ